MARIPATVCISLGLCCFLLILPACESRQNKEKKSGGAGTSWRATPKADLEDAGMPPGGTENPDKVKPQAPPQETKSQPPQPVEQPKPKETEKPQPLTPPKTIPQVTLSEKLAATCLVKFRDAFPEGQLADLSGKTQTLSELYGKRLTVVFLWSNGKSDYTRSAMNIALGDLQLDVLDKYQKDDLRVVGIDVGGAPEIVKPQIEKSGAKFPVLLDPEETFLRKIATTTKEIPRIDLPRVYLLDAVGHVLWYDIDFTYISRHDLKEAIEAVLKEMKK